MLGEVTSNSTPGKPENRENKPTVAGHPTIDFYQTKPNQPGNPRTPSDGPATKRLTDDRSTITDVLSIGVGTYAGAEQNPELMTRSGPSHGIPCRRGIGFRAVLPPATLPNHMGEETELGEK